MTMNYAQDSTGTALGLTLLFAGIVLYIVLLLGVYALFSWMLSRVFRKAGIDRWKAWVPLYNSWILLEMGGQAGWIALLALVPGVNIVATVFLCIAVYHLDFAFQKENVGWLVLFIFVPVVWLAILAFDGSRWEPSRMSVRPNFGPNVPWPSEGHA